MNYNIKGTDIPITPELRSYVEKKLSSLDKFLPDLGAARADVELQFLAGEAKTHRSEIMLYEPSLPAPVRAEARGSAMHEAIDMSVGQLTAELTRAKKKRLHMVRRGAGRVKDFIRGFRGKL
jgi:putative sigma-54 modulation protein